MVFLSSLISNLLSNFYTPHLLRASCVMDFSVESLTYFYFGWSSIENSSTIFLQTSRSSIAPRRSPMSSPTSLATVSRNVSGLRPRPACGRRQGKIWDGLVRCPHKLASKASSALSKYRCNGSEVSMYNTFSGRSGVSFHIPMYCIKHPLRWPFTKIAAGPVLFRCRSWYFSSSSISCISCLLVHVRWGLQGIWFKLEISYICSEGYTWGVK